MELGKEGNGDRKVQAVERLVLSRISKTMDSAKRLSVQLVFTLVCVPKLLRVFIHLDDGHRRVNVFLYVACNFR